MTTNPMIQMQGAFEIIPPTQPGTPTTEQALCDAIDIKRNDLQMQYLTRGTSLSLEYVAIKEEYADYSALTVTVLTGLSLVDKQKRFPTAMTEIALSGKTLAQVMASYGVAITANDKANRVIGRIAVVAKANIRAAITLAAKQKVFTDINWAWTPGF